MALRQLVEAAFFFAIIQEEILKPESVNPNQSVDTGAEIIKFTIFWQRKNCGILKSGIN